MSAENSIKPGRAAPDGQAPATTFAIPDDLAARYAVRIVEGPAGGYRRVGLFAGSDRINPALEIANERIFARNHDPETVASLVKLAAHNGWNRIDLEGAPEFRKAVWAAATRDGLAVSGYEPSFAEQEQAATQRRADTERREREAAKPVAVTQSIDTAVEAERVQGVPLRQEPDRRRRESEDLAELFLHGAAETIAAEPRLANARQAQAVMKTHIAEVFAGDVAHTNAATRESRQMISDVLRRGLDVSVREITPERQIEPIRSPEMER